MRRGRVCQARQRLRLTRGSSRDGLMRRGRVCRARQQVDPAPLGRLGALMRSSGACRTRTRRLVLECRAVTLAVTRSGL